PELVPVWVEVSPEVLRARLQARGREGAEEIEKRLARAPKNQVLGRRGELIRNDGELRLAGDTLVNLIRHGSGSEVVSCA
ncbi:MAG: phosphonate metabolism protein/1,5-bisphosphokinase (PRPP-forming) PhnN, partial [Burkholderiaceae bacterium]|nr:phosphonate metabolism protein/1,5-bisphosphokinase (PRPP-forming) PhnN [Burkholderiaceae bacterium]